MILYEIFPNKTLKILEDENTYINENLISSVHIKLPSTFGDYPVKELTAELRFYFPEGDYMAYAVDTQQARPEVPITNDITEKPQTLSVMLFFYKSGNVIGKTNSVDKVVLDAPLKGEPLTPRAEFDEVIAEQRERVAEQAETITEQAETISSQGERITELSGEVTELETENTRLENLTETQRETIQYMVDNPPQPQLYTPPEPIIPESETRVYTPPQNYDGFASFTVQAYDYSLLKSICERTGGFNLTLPSYVHSIGSYLFSGWTGLISFVATAITSIGANGFSGCSNLKKVVLNEGVLSVGNSAFANCSNLEEINLPSSLSSWGNYIIFNGCTSLLNVTLGNNFNCNGVFLSFSSKFTAETIVAWLEALADRTGQTAYTLAMGTTNLNKLTDEQKAIAINKNWNLA